MFYIALSTMASLFLCIIVGFIAAKQKILNEDTIDKLNVLLLNITFPFMMISIFNIELTSQILNSFIPLFLFGIIYQSLLFIFVVVFIKLVKIDKNQKQVTMFAMVFTNTGFIGIPLIASVFGSEALLYASLLNIPFNITCFSFGVYLLQPKNTNVISIKQILLKPTMVGIWIGCILMLSQLIIPGTFEVDGKIVRLPAFLTRTINMIGNITSPLAMIIVGASLAETKFKNVFTNYKLHAFAFVKSIIAPFLIYLVLKPFIINELILVIVVIFSGLPTATLATVLSEQFKHDYVYASELVFITTLYSLITIPLLLIVIM